MTDSFLLSSFTIALLFSGNMNVEGHLNKSTRTIDDSIKDLVFTWNINKESFIEKEGIENLALFLEPYRLFIQIPLITLDWWVDQLRFIYPQVISDYFKHYFRLRRSAIHIFLAEVDRQADLVTS